jgi:predicted amidophosphoribosyltransferase
MNCIGCQRQLEPMADDLTLCPQCRAEANEKIRIKKEKEKERTDE